MRDLRCGAAALWLAVACTSWRCAAGAPRLAVWDPEQGTHETRFKADRALHDQAAAWLKEAGCEVTRVSAAQMGDSAFLTAGRFDACVSAGDAVPRRAIPALLAFADAGGVLVALNARVPFLVAVEPEKDGWWTMSPKQPSFAWQTHDVLGAVGGRYIYNPVMHDLGVNHTATPLLKRYLPEASDIPNSKRPSHFVVPANGGVFYPLLRSRRYDGVDATPQMWVMRCGQRTAVVSSDAGYTGEGDTNFWRCGRATVSALARLAKDLHDGTLRLTPEMAIDLSEKTPPPEPMTTREVRGQGVDPEGARPLARWGRFDGSCAELGPVLPSGQTMELAAGAEARKVPRGLMPGASLRLRAEGVSEAAQPRFLRLRAAFNGRDVAFCARAGDAVLWNERVTSPDAGGAGNTQAPNLKGLSMEFVRIIYLAPPIGADAGLTLANTGSSAMYLDAVQIETPGVPCAMRIGLNGGYLPEALGKDKVSRELTRTWGGLRANIRTQFVGPPGDPKRWNRCEAILKTALEINPHVELVWEGTPKWCAVSPERFAEGEKVGRSHVVPPDPAKYAEIVEYFASRYGERIELFELWNEANSQQFWRGTYQEYADFCKAVIPVIRKNAPHAKIVTTGTAGWSDAFFDALLRQGVTELVDWIPNHVYAGKSAGWDMAYGVGQGGLYAAGVSKACYCNEQGFVFRNSEWFTAPPVFTPHLQSVMLSQGMARLLAGDATGVSVFHAGGNTHPFGLIDEQGVLRPAYAVVRDYLTLNNGRRWNVALTAEGDGVLEGVYAAASLHPDGSVTVVLNPAEVASLIPDAVEAVPEDTASGSETLDLLKTVRANTFFGTSSRASGGVRLTPAAGKAYVGYELPIVADPARLPLLEVVASGCAGSWGMTVQSDGQQVPLLADCKDGVARADLRTALKGVARRKTSLTLRASAPMTVAAVRLSVDPAAPMVAMAQAPATAVRKPLPVRLQVPLTQTVSACRATAAESDVAVPMEQHLLQAKGHTCVDLRVGLTGRTVITVKPEFSATR